MVKPKGSAMAFITNVCQGQFKQMFSVRIDIILCVMVTVTENQLYIAGKRFHHEMGSCFVFETTPGHDL